LAVIAEIIMSKEIYLPKPYCAAICKNAMGEMCIEHCVPTRRAKWFKLRDDLSIEDMPRFPTEAFVSEMTGDERNVILAAYTAKLVDQAQGYKNEPKFIRRPHINDPRVSRVSEDQQGKVILFSQSEEVAPHQDRQEHSRENVGHKSLVDAAD
jgi:hypothetical protein